MRFVQFIADGFKGLAVEVKGTLYGLTENQLGYPGDLQDLIQLGPYALQEAYQLLLSTTLIPPEKLHYLPPISRPGKIICVDLPEHSPVATPYQQHQGPLFYARFASTLVAQSQPLIQHAGSDACHYKGQLAVIIGAQCRHISRGKALEYVAGYSLFTETRSMGEAHPDQHWTMNLNADHSAAFGPIFVSASELPKGAHGLNVTTRLNNTIVDRSNTASMAFSVAELIATLSETLTLEPCDVIVTTMTCAESASLSGPVIPHTGDICSLEIEGIGRLVNPIALPSHVVLPLKHVLH